MSEKIIDDLSNQVANFYKAGGRYVLYGSVIPRSFKEGSDPALAAGKTTTCFLNIFDSESKQNVVAYLESSDPGYVLAKITGIMAQPPVEDANAAYNRITMNYGTYKGKTVAEFVQGTDNDGIKAEYNRLKSTVDKYPRNTQVADAIWAAVEAKKNGKLNAASSQILLEEVKTPNNKKVDERGLTACRTLTISYTPGTPEPFSINIKNFMAPPTQALVGAKFSQAQDMKDLKMSLSEKEIFELFDEMVKAKDMYARATEGSRIKYADSKAWKGGATNASSSGVLMANV